MKTINIWVTNLFDTFDMSSADEYLSGSGQIIPIFPGRVNVMNTDDMINRIRNKISGKFKITDWVVLAGSSVVSALVVGEIAKQFGEIHLLVWDARERIYKPRWINFKQ